MPVILATLKAEIGRIMVSGQYGQIIFRTPSPNITRTKWTGGVAQVVECLLCKLPVLNSKPQSNKQKKKQKKFHDGSVLSL
jgi:hypothetical protein